MTLEHKILGQGIASNIETAQFTEGIVSLSLSGTVAAHSTDGISWTEIAIPYSGSWRDVVFENEIFFAAEGNGREILSTDGITWSAADFGGSYNRAHSGNGKFFLFGTSSGVWSSDGINWSGLTTPPLDRPTFLAHSENLFVGIVSNSTTSVTSTDGLNWQSNYNVLPSSSSWNAIAFGNGVFVATTYNDNVSAYSTDGISWSSSSMSDFDREPLVFANNLFYSFSDSGIVSTSTNGQTWNDISMSGLSGYFARVVYDESLSLFVTAKFNTNQAYYSTDGVTWTSSTLPSTTEWHAVQSGSYTASSYIPKTAYTVPPNTETVISSIFVSNTSASTDTYDLAVVPSGETLSDVHYIRKSVELPANDFDIVKTKITLSAGDKIISRSLYNNIQINIFGVENT